LIERRFRLAALLVSLGIAVRALAVLLLQSHHVPRSTYEHGEIAANLLAGRGFSVRFLGAEGPTSQQAPVYPAIVALTYAIGGVEKPGSLLLLELGQSIMGGLLVAGVLALASHVTGGRSAATAVAGLIAAIHPSLVYAATHVQVALLGATLLTWSLVWGLKTGTSGKPIHALITGGLLAITSLTDPILALGTVGVIWAIFQGRASFAWDRTRTARLAALVLLAAALCVMPWIVRNALVHGEFVAIKSTLGYAFWQGNCALSEGTDKVARPSVERVLMRGDSRGGLPALNETLWAARHEAGCVDDIALSRADRQLLASVSEPARARILFRRALEDLRQRPSRYLELCLRRFRYFWVFDETNPKTRVLAYRVSHLGLLLLAGCGLALARRDVRRRLAPTVATAALIALFHTLTIVSARFHIPIEPLMAVWAGAGLTCLKERPRHSAAAGYHIVGVGLVSRLDRHGLVGRIRSFL
jgi:hypothetical protein